MRELIVYYVKNNLYVMLLFFGSAFFVSCEKDPYEKDKPGNNGNVSWDTLTGLGHEESGDYTWDAGSVIVITLEGNTISTVSGNVSVNGSTATIRKEGNYLLTGSLSNGSIIVDSEDHALVRIIMSNVTIHNDAGPAILVEKSRKTIINLEGDSQNYLSDGSSYSNPQDDPNAALFSKSNLSIFGSGTLTVDGNYNDGITGKDGLIVKSGNIIVSSPDDGIRGKDYLIIDSPNIELNIGGDGLKSDDIEGPDTGQIQIYGGRINAITGGDGLSAENTILATGGYIQILAGGGNASDTSSISQKGIKAGKSVLLQPDSIRVDAADHAIDSDGIIEIAGGVYTLFSARAGLHSNTSTTINGGDINIIRSLEGFESNVININGGTVKIISIDDCFSATAGYDVDVDDGSFIGINDGYLVLDCILGDGIDSNGSIELNGGRVIIHGPQSAPEVAVDFNKSFNITGGFLVGSGTNSELIDYPDTSSTQNSIVAIFAEDYPKATIFNIRDDDGRNILTFQPTSQYQSILFTSPELHAGETYYLTIGGITTGENIDGLIDGDYSNGTFLSAITITNTVTVLPDLKFSGDIE